MLSFEYFVLLKTVILKKDHIYTINYPLTPEEEYLANDLFSVVAIL